MADPAKSRRAGSAFEIALMKHLREQGFDVERLRLTGAKDEGDLVIRFANGERLVIEAKSGAMHPAEFVRQAQQETSNYIEHRDLSTTPQGVDGVAVVKARGKGIGESYVLTTLADYLRGRS